MEEEKEGNFSLDQIARYAAKILVMLKALHFNREIQCCFAPKKDPNGVQKMTYFLTNKLLEKERKHWD